MRLIVSEARVTAEQALWHGSLVIVVRARTREEAIASVRLADALTLPDGRHVGLARYRPISLCAVTREWHRPTVTEDPQIIKADLRPPLDVGAL